jgi:large subunit ribosomal protein L9
MRVVFLNDVDGVARAGEIKNVADGFARNFLLPRKLASAATTAEVKRAEAIAHKLALEDIKRDGAAQLVADRLMANPIVMRARVGEQGRLYGSITASDIADELTRLSGAEIDHRKVMLDAPIKEAGPKEVAVSLSRNVKATLTIEVAGLEEE